MTFVSSHKVRFAHIDAAGIVFYPRYFELLNAAIEDYFAKAVGVDFAAMHVTRKLGVPLVKLESQFIAPSRLGDDLDFVVQVESVGRRSAGFWVEVRCGDELRFSARLVLVCMDLVSGQSTPWPLDMRPVIDAAAPADGAASLL